MYYTDNGESSFVLDNVHAAILLSPQAKKKHTHNVFHLRRLFILLNFNRLIQQLMIDKFNSDYNIFLQI